jgi:hypothetical protein
MSADRGLELTDESYYLLSYLHWRELSATVTFFGAYFEYPFRLLGENLSLIRLYGLFLLWVAGFAFFQGLAKYFGRLTDSQPGKQWLLLITTLSLSFTYYTHEPTLRAPSYNLLSLFWMLISTGMLFSVISGQEHESKLRWQSLAYGFCICALTFTKATTGGLLFGVHVLIYVTHCGHSGWPKLWTHLPPLVLGAALNLVLISLLAPEWPAMLASGIKQLDVLDNRSHVILSSLSKIHHHIYTDLIKHGFSYLVVIGVHSVVAIFLVKWYRKALGWWIVLLVALYALHIVLTHPRGTIWFTPLVLLAAALWSTEFLARKNRELEPSDVWVFILFILLLSISFVFSIGTNIPIHMHSRMAAIFPMAFILLLLHRLNTLSLIAKPLLGLALAALATPAIFYQIPPWLNKAYTYRLRTPLISQNISMVTGNGRDVILVDHITADELNGFATMAMSNGFKTGMPILDLTGDGPGLIYRLGGRPLGVAWLLGGYPGSSQVASMVVGKMERSQLQCAWLLTSNDAPRRIQGWTSILEQQAGAFAHEKIGQFQLTRIYRWRGPFLPTATIEVWRPTDATCGGHGN